MRPIDADALWKQMEEYDDYMGAKEAHDINMIHRDSILFAIEQAPTIDAVPVVRCRKCRKWDYVDYCCMKHLKTTSPDYYCADGKRREER